MYHFESLFLLYKFKKAICQVFNRNGLKITIEANKKTIDYLDVTLNLTTGKHHPYIKPGNTPLYIDTRSNHPPSVIKAVPEGINNRLSLLSSDEHIFKNAIPIYQESLKNSGYKYEMKFKPTTPSNRNQQKRKRKRNITWFNPPFDMQVKTKVGNKFITIIEECFPDGHRLKPIFNRNTLKLSYSCMPNVKTKIDQHNKSQLKKPEDNNSCNCRNKNNCPLEGKCQESSIVYQATVTTNQPTNQGATIESKETYIGLTETTFKLRYANHTQSFRNSKLRNATELSKHIWSLKEKNKDYKLKWKIIKKAPAYNNRSKRCHLCLQEKYYIICHPEMSSLNQKSGIINSCRHKSKYTLSNHPT